MIGCSCVAKKVVEPNREAVCLACKRDYDHCICVSRTAVRADAHDMSGFKGAVRRPYPEKHIDRLVHEGMRFYVNRDPVGLSNWLRRELA